MGGLGNTYHYRCRNCGIQVSSDDSPDIEEEEDDEEEYS